MKGASFPGLTNYIGYDENTGTLVHIHLHYELTIGTPYLKEYVTPWGSYILQTRIREPETDVWISNPNVELVLLLIRYALKIRRWNPLSRKSHYSHFLEEYEWLIERCDNQSVQEVTTELLNKEVASQIQQMVSQRPDISQFHALRKVVLPFLNQYSTHRKGMRVILPFVRKGFRGFGKLNEKVLHQPIPTRRTSAPGGVEIAFVGVDGSGKSTNVETLADWLSWKVDIYSVYFGSGDGRSSLLRLPLKKLNDLRNRATANKSTEKEPSLSDETPANPHTAGSEKVGFLKAVWALTLAREKKKKRKKARRARNKGMIVIMDRYPQNQYPGLNDGPLLQPWVESDSRILRWLSKWEGGIYKSLHKHPPDLVIKLDTDPEIAKERKPETPMKELQLKSAIIDGLEYMDCRMVSISTEQELDDVLRQVKTEVWDSI